MNLLTLTLAAAVTTAAALFSSLAPLMTTTQQQECAMPATTERPALNRITGIVACVNPRGLKLEGEQGWRNVSQFATIPVMPEPGQLVTLGMDRAGFVRSWTPTSGPAPEWAKAPVVDNASLADALDKSADMLNSERPLPPSRDTQIARMNALAHAVALYPHLLYATPDDAEQVAYAVEELAGRFESWILRPVQP